MAGAGAGASCPMQEDHVSMGWAAARKLRTAAWRQSTGPATDRGRAPAPQLVGTAEGGVGAGAGASCQMPSSISALRWLRRTR